MPLPQSLIIIFENLHPPLLQRYQKPQMANADSTKRHLTGDSAPLPDLPGEIIPEILFKLPVKSLLKFRCVSKSWLSLISSTQFVNRHLKISTNDNVDSHNRLVFGSGLRPTLFHTFSLNPKKGDGNSCVDTLAFDCPPLNESDDAIRIVGSCNGLICVALDRCGGVVLWNPSTRKSKKLPICDMNAFGTQYGFGYDSSNNEYKVFEFSFINNDGEGYEDDEAQFKVHTSRTDSWSTMTWPGGEVFDGPGVFVTQCIHWKVRYDGSRSNWGVVAQNVGTEACSVLELPVAVSDEKVMLGVSGGCLCASYDCRSYMDVWVMKESWMKLACFPYPWYHYVRPDGKVRPKALFVSGNGGAILNLGSDLIMYMPSQCPEIYHLGDGDELEAATYSESFL